MDLKKHFRVSITDELPDRDSEDYHPLQNVLWALDFWREKAQENWILGKAFALDEDRVKSKSRRNAFKTRNPDKPIKEGWTVSKLGDKGEKDGTYILNGIVKCGNYIYSNTDNGKMHNIIEKQISCSALISKVPGEQLFWTVPMSQYYIFQMPQLCGRSRWLVP